MAEKLDIEPVNVRLRRLQAHIECIETNYRSFAPRLNDYRLSIDPNENATEHVERIHMDWVIPEEWSVILGEIMHNLRSTLDNLVCQLVLSGGNQPGDNHEFPIAHDGDWYDRVATRKLRNVPEAARRIIDKVQPCKGPANLIRVHPLWIVHNLNRIDKHRGLHVVAAYPAKGEFEVTAEMSAAEGKMRLWYCPLEDGTEVRSFITRTPFHGNVPVGNVVTLDVVVRETDETPFYGFPDVARTCALAVNQTVSAVAAAVTTG